MSNKQVVFAVPQMSRRFLAVAMPSWMRILDKFQLMHLQKRELNTHIAFESFDWMSAFNLYLGLGNLFDYLNNWIENPLSQTDVSERHIEVMEEDNMDGKRALDAALRNVSCEFGNSNDNKNGNNNNDGNDKSNSNSNDNIFNKNAVGKSLSDAATSDFSDVNSFLTSLNDDTKIILPSVSAVLTVATISIKSWQIRHEKQQIDVNMSPVKNFILYEGEGEDRKVILNLPPPPASLSFHLFLHRYLASVISESCKYHQHTEAILVLQKRLSCLHGYPSKSLIIRDINDSNIEKNNDSDGKLSHNINENKIYNDMDSSIDNDGNNDNKNSSNNNDKYSDNANTLMGFIDYPLQCALFASQIKLGMWRRNGTSMNDQLMNYKDPPYCRVLFDLDVLLIQFCTVQYGSKALVTHIFHRYGVLQYLSARQLTVGCSDKKNVEELRSLSNNVCILNDFIYNSLLSLK